MSMTEGECKIECSLGTVILFFRCEPVDTARLFRNIDKRPRFELAYWSVRAQPLRCSSSRSHLHIVLRQLSWSFKWFFSLLTSIVCTQFPLLQHSCLYQCLKGDEIAQPSSKLRIEIWHFRRSYNEFLVRHDNWLAQSHISTESHIQLHTMLVQFIWLKDHNKTTGFRQDMHKTHDIHIHLLSSNFMAWPWVSWWGYSQSQGHEELQHLGVVWCTKTSDRVPTLHSLETLCATSQVVTFRHIVEDIIVAVKSRIDETNRRFTGSSKLLIQLQRAICQQQTF